MVSQTSQTNESSSTVTLQTRYEVLRMEEIPVIDLTPHPRNPRPTFHLSDDDPKLMALGDSIKLSGQTTMAMVFEQVDKPGKYTILQGERRWRACKIAEVPKLKCVVVNTPVTEAEELEWLGIEEAFKQSWQPFFMLRHAWNVANEHGIPVDHPQMPLKTGLTISDLRMAKKIFSLCSEIQNMCIQYEESLYRQSIRGEGKRRLKLSFIDGKRVVEFPVNKAAIVWDIFEALRENFASVCDEYTNEELQLLVANRATKIGSSFRDLEQFLAALKTIDPPPGMLTQIATLLENPRKTLRDVNRVAGTQEYVTLNTFIKRSTLVRKNIEIAVKNKNRIGNNVDFLRDCQTEALRLINEASNLERILSDQIAKASNY